MHYTTLEAFGQYIFKHIYKDIQNTTVLSCVGTFVSLPLVISLQVRNQADDRLVVHATRQLEMQINRPKNSFGLFVLFLQLRTEQSTVIPAISNA